MAHTHTLTHRPDDNAHALLAHEWLLTNGAGGFAMGTAAGANTRRYHGLLIAAKTPPVGRVMVLNQMWETLELHSSDSTQTLEFSTNLFRDGDTLRFVPDSPPMLRRLDRGLDVVWSYQWGGLTFTRRLLLHHDRPTATLHYDLAGLDAVCASATLRLRPMVTLRDFHHLIRMDDAAYQYEERGEALTVTRDRVSATYHAPGGTYQHGPDWWYNLHYPVEHHRGTDDTEDLLVPGCFTVELGSQAEANATFTATLGDAPAKPMATAKQHEDRLKPIATHLQAEFSAGLSETGNPKSEIAAILAQAADDFIVKRAVGDRTLSTIIAGYPWFADWGRDTFIALPGLMLCTGRFEEARDTLAAFAAAIRDGLVPNRFDDEDPTLAHYNTIDASMWYLHAALEYLDATDDTAAWNDWLAQACVSIVDAYAQGTAAMGHDGRPVEIRMDSDGLIAGGDDHSQLTWMDAATPAPGNGQPHVFTPRPGKCIEINGLWYSALVRLSAKLDKPYKKQATRYAKLAQQVKTSFARAFWSDELGYFIDHIAPAGTAAPGPDRSLRPNQYIACALAHSPVEPAHRQRAVAAGLSKLLTPVGMRTLPTDDPAFFADYRGTQYERDQTYHRGMVWPWLIGPFAESVLRAGGFSDEAKLQTRQIMGPLVDRLTTADHPGCLGQLHEIHEPLDPFAPRGCPAQAWSVAETLRVLTLIGK